MQFSKRIFWLFAVFLLVGAIFLPLANKDRAAAASPTFKIVAGRAGFWQVGQDQTGAFWFVSPQGKREFLNTVTTVQPTQASGDGTSPGYRSLDWKGNDRLWATSTVKRIRQFGFKGIGAWSNEALYDCDMPFTRCLNLSAFPPKNARLLFSPEWKSAVEKAVRDQVVPLKDNSNLVGYFSDNELSWTDAGMGARLYFDNRPQEDQNRLEVVSVIKTLWPSVEDFNRDWHVSLANWAELQGLPKLPNGPQAAYDRLLSAWMTHVSEQYFRVTTSLIRQYDPHHLILGVRFKGYAVTEVVRATRGLTDVQSINIYAGDSRLDPRTFTMISEESRQPIMISEFSFQSLDGQSGNRNLCNFPAPVADQKARAAGYSLFVSRLAGVPYIIGADWFQWMDEPPQGRGDGEDANVGVVDIYDRPYPLLLDAVRQTGPRLDALHTASASGSNRDIWRSVAAD